MYGRPGLGKDFLAFRQTNRERSCIRPLNAAFERGPWWRSRIEFQSLRRAVTRDDGAECFDPGFLTILPSHHNCPSDWMSASAAAVALQQAAAGAFAGSRYGSPLTSMAQRIRAVLAASATITTL